MRIPPHDTFSSQKRIAEAGGIQPLAAVLEHSTNVVLARRALDTWVELGGLPALVKLMSHRSPSLAARAAARISVLLAPTPHQAGDSHETQAQAAEAAVQSSSSTRSEKREAASESVAGSADAEGALEDSDGLSGVGDSGQEVERSSCLSGPDLEVRLVGAGLVPAVLRLCGHPQSVAAEAGLRLLLRLCPNPEHRDRLVDQGCLQVLQGLMLGPYPPVVTQLATAGWQQLCSKPGVSLS